MTTPTHAFMALAKANQTRTDIAAMRRRIRAGEIELAELLEDPPECLLNLALVEVIRLGWTRYSGWRSSSMLERLGREAVRDDINLLIALGRSSQHSRRWVATHVRWSRTKTQSRTIIGDCA